MAELVLPPPGARFVVVNPRRPGSDMSTSRFVMPRLKSRDEMYDVYFVDRLSKRARSELVPFMIVGATDPGALFLVTYDIKSKERRYSYTRIREALTYQLCAKVGASAYLCPHESAADAIVDYVTHYSVVPVKPATPEAEEAARQAFEGLVADIAGGLEEAAKELANARNRGAAARRALALADKARRAISGPAAERVEKLFGAGILDPIRRALEEVEEARRGGVIPG